MNNSTSGRILPVRANLLVFDLDGTLFDTLGDLGHSVNYALAQFGLPPHGDAEIRSFIGNGSLNLIKRSLGAERENMAAEVHGVFMAHYFENCLKATRPYEGVLEFLRAYTGPCAVLTNKPIVPTRKILAHFGLAERFMGVLGGDDAPARKPDPAGLKWLMQLAKVDPAQTVMVGDDVPDVTVAKNAGVRSVAITGGFGKIDDLAPLAPDWLVPSFSAFVDLVVP